MQELLDKLQNEPIALIVIAGLAVGIAFLFLIPTLFNYIRSFHIPLLKSKDEKSKKPEEAKNLEETKEPEPVKSSKSIVSKIKIPAPVFQKLNFKLRFRFKPLKYLIFGLVSILLVGTAIFSFDFFLRPVRMMDAWQLKLEKGEQLAKLQKGGLGSWPEAKIYLIDARSNESYQKGHLRGAENFPSYRAAEFYPIEDIPVVVYSSEFSLIEARKVADAIEENGRSGRIQYENPGKIFVVKDGYEGLKKAGFKIESEENKE